MTRLKMNLKKLPVVFLAMVILATAFVVTGCGKTVIDIEEAKLLDVDFEGFDGAAKAVLTVDEKKLKSLKKEYRDDNNYSEIKDFLDSISFVMEDESLNGKLSNGDTFNIVVTYDEDIAEESNIGVKNEIISYEIKKSKLKKGTEIDAFKGFKLTYSGDNGDAYAFTDATGCDPLVEEAGIYFSVENDNNGELKNGDKVTVKAESFNDLEEEGYFLKETTKEFTVEGLVGARETLEGVDFSSVAEDMLDEVEDETQDDFDLAYYNYKFNSGKKRDINSFDFKFTPSVELVKYAYTYDPKDIEYENCLVAYYKLTVNIECTDDQYGFEDDANLMKKGDKDVGVCYIAVKSSSFKVTSDNKIDDEYMYFSIASGETIEDCAKELNIDKYTSEYFDASFKKLDDSASEPTEPATEKATEEATETATEKATEEATEAEESATEKATTKKAE